MQLERLRIQWFRNITAAGLTLAPGLNLFTGANGQGKTNLLEAVGLLATGRSFRRATPRTMRQHGSDGFRLEGESRAGGLDHRIRFISQGERLSARLNDKPMRGASAMGQALAVVVFTPDSLRLVKGGPGERRGWLDWAVFSRERGYATLAREYQKALASRNRLLRERRPDPAQLDAWEAQLARLGARISLRRRRACARLEEHLAPHLAALALAGPCFTIALSCQLDRDGAGWDEAAAVARYGQWLREARITDARAGNTGVGPHRDDLRLQMDGRPLLRYGSQGQQKRFALALKLAEAAFLEAGLGEPPLFLLDDPASELDRAGIGLFMEILAASGRQLLVTTCHREEIPWPQRPGGLFTVDAGEFSPIDGA